MSNPKDSIGRSKPGFSLLPLAVLYEVIVVLRLGAKKYGPWNWRSAKVNETVYVDAAIRHLTQYLAGEDIDDESGVPHITHAITGLLILRDAQKHACSVDDRKVSHRLRLNEIIERISAIESPTVEAVDTGASAIEPPSPEAVDAAFSDRDNATIDAAHPVTNEDVGRKFINRRGQVVEIASVNDRRFYAKGFIYHLDGTCPGVSSQDAVRFCPPFYITKEDVGRHVVARDGEVCKIAEHDGTLEYPIRVKRLSQGVHTWHRATGEAAGIRADHAYTLVDFATPEQVERATSTQAAVCPPEITISSRDIGRWLTCRNGGRAQITAFSGVESRYPVEVRDESGFLTLHTIHGLRDAAVESDLDLVAFEPDHPLQITKADVGRKVKDRLGKVGQILGTGDESLGPYPVRVRFSHGDELYTTEGRYITTFKFRLDLVEFASEPEPEFRITAEDIGRKVLSECGDTWTITHFTDDGSYRVRATKGETGTGESFTAEGYLYKHNLPESKHNLVEFVDEPVFKITAADVGRKVRTRSGRIEQITRFDSTDDKYPVMATCHNCDFDWFTATGQCYDSKLSQEDLVEFAADEEFRITPGDVGRKARDANGKIWTIEEVDDEDEDDYDEDDYSVSARCGDEQDTFTCKGYYFWDNRSPEKSLVEFVVEELKITAADIGRRVRSEGGEIWTITRLNDDRLYPVVAARDDGEEEEFTPEGYYHVGNHPESLNTLVEFVDCPITTCDNGRYGRIARGDLVQITNGGGRYRTLDDNLRIYIDGRGVANVEPARYNVVQLADPVDSDHPLTPEDVGCEVIRRDGNTDTLTEFEADVVYQYRSAANCWLASGRWHRRRSDDNRDIVAIFREAK